MHTIAAYNYAYMATVYLRGKTWWAQFNDIHGKRVARSTKIKEGDSTKPRRKKEARDAANRMEVAERKRRMQHSGLGSAYAHIVETAAREADQGLLTMVRAEKLIMEIHAIAHPEHQDKSLGCQIDEWVENQEPFVAENTIRGYRQCAANLRQSMPQAVIEGPVRKLTSEAVLSALKLMNTPKDADPPGLGLRAASANLALGMLRRVLEDAVRKDLARTNVAKAIKKLPKADSRPRAPFTLKEVRSLLSEAKSRYNHDEHEGLILIAAYTGLRLMDVAGLSSENVHGNRLVVSVRKVQRGTKKVVRIPMSPPVVRWIGDRQGPFFPTLSQKSSQLLSQAFKRIMKWAKVPREVNHDGERAVRSFHSLRHTFTSWLADADVHADVRMALTGHKSSGIHAIYSHHDEALDKAINALPGA